MLYLVYDAERTLGPEYLLPVATAVWRAEEVGRQDCSYPEYPRPWLYGRARGGSGARAGCEIAVVCAVGLVGRQPGTGPCSVSSRRVPQERRTVRW